MGGLFLDASSSNTTMDAPHTSASLSSAAMGTSVLPLTNAGLMTAKTAAGGFHYNGSLNYHDYKQLLMQLGHDRRALGKPLNSPFPPNLTDRTDDMTDWRADQANWSLDNLPNIIYVFKQPDSWLKSDLLKEPPLKRYQIYGKYLRDIPCLPDHISSRLEGWRYEYWTRLDPRISFRRDLCPRMRPDMRKGARASTLQMARNRFRRDCKVLGWVTRGHKFEEHLADLEQEMRANNIDPQRNTTRGLSWGLINPAMGEAGGRIAIKDSLRLGSTVEAQPHHFPGAAMPPPPHRNLRRSLPPVRRSPAPGVDNKAASGFAKGKHSASSDESSEWSNSESQSQSESERSRQRKKRKPFPGHLIPQPFNPLPPAPTAWSAPKAPPSQDNQDNLRLEDRMARGGWYDNSGYHPVAADNKVGELPAPGDIHFVR